MLLMFGPIIIIVAAIVVVIIMLMSSYWLYACGLLGFLATNSWISAVLWNGLKINGHVLEVILFFFLLYIPELYMQCNNQESLQA